MVKSGSEAIRRHFQLAAEFMETARSNFDNGYFRSAADRAYYAMFHAATAALLGKGIREVKSHAALIQLFGKEFVATKLVDAEMNKQLQRAFDVRQKSDYDIAASFDENNVEQMVERAQEFVQKTKEILGIT